MEKIIVKAINLKKTYKMSKTNTVKALDGVDLEIKEGDFSAIVGPSGCGKSTLMHILGLLDKPDSGTLMIDGDDLSSLKESIAYKIRAKKIGFIFQGFNLIPTLTAFENVVLAGKYRGTKIAERKAR
ncbi:MAG: ATP-binding cassette domain-containing protein, partial [bacterium]